MWAIRRTSSISLKPQTFSAVTFSTSRAEHEILGCSYVDITRFSDPLPHPSDGSRLLKRYYFGTQATSKHVYSSLASRNCSGEKDDDLEDGFSELETSSSESDVEDESVSDDELISEPELSKEEGNDLAMEVHENEMEASDAESEPVKNIGQHKRAFSALFKAVMDSPTLPVEKVLDKWLLKGDIITRSDISLAMLEFRKRRMYVKALELSKWLESRKIVEFNEKDYASRVDLIAKAHGLQAAENYIEKIPESSRGQFIYETLLVNCVSSFNKTKAEQVFNKMKDLKLPITTSACNQLLLLYKKTNKKKIADVLLLMEENKVEPSIFTYRLLIDIKGQANDINGMEKIVETMKAKDLEPDLKIRALLARHYMYGGLNEKANVVLREMEGSDLKENRCACLYLLPLYAELGSVDDVKRVWEVCKSNPWLNECMNAIDAWGKLRKVEEAEGVFDQMSKRWKRIPSKHFAAMLKIYANNKMLSKGKDLVKQMADSGCEIGPLSWDALVRLYIEAGELEKADSFLRRASELNPVKPFFDTYMMILKEYSRRGDVHNAEKMFYRLRQDGYVSRPTPYHSLLQTYINAKAPAYGFRERMKADNIMVNHSFAGELALADPFKFNRTTVVDLLD